MPAFHELTSARPNPSAARPAIGAHAHWSTVAQGGGKRRHRRRRRGIPAAGMELRRRRGGGAGAARRGEAPHRGGAPRQGNASRGGADIGADELADGGRRRCARAGEERRVGEERHVGEEPLVGDGRDEERRRRRRRRKRGEAAIWGKTAKCRSVRRWGLYRIPDLLSRVVFTTVTKCPLVSCRIMTRD
jgi:hypothetical protein